MRDSNPGGDGVPVALPQDQGRASCTSEPQKLVPGMAVENHTPLPHVLREGWLSRQPTAQLH